MATPNTTLIAGQSETVTAIPEDSSGNLGSTATGSIPAWACSDPTIATLMVAGDGLSAKLTAVASGTATVTVSGVSNFADSAISGQFTVTVTEAPATQFGFTFGSPS